MKKISVALIAVTFILVLSGCALFGTVFNVASSVNESDLTVTPVSAEEIIESEDGEFSVTLPDTWKEMKDLNEEADIAIGSDYRASYMMALIEAKVDLAYNFEEWSNIVLGTTMDAMENTEISEPTEIIINGCPAIQYILVGTFDNANIKYLLTYIDGEENYGQILCWSLVSDFEESEDQFQQIVQSLRGI